MKKPTEILKRADDMDADVLDQDSRRVEMSISSETPVSRYFGDEIIDHSEDGIDLEFIGSGRAPLLLDHDPTKQIGVVEAVKLDSEARKLRAVVRFSKNAQADEVYQDILDGIRGNVSIGYRINEMVLIESKNDMESYRVNISPMEVSIVSVPADPNVGVGRAEPEHKEVIKMSEVTKQKTEVRAEQPKVVDSYRSDAAEIVKLGQAHKQSDLAGQAIAEGKTAQEFRNMLLDQLAQAPVPAADPSKHQVDAPEVKDYSLMRALDALQSGDWRQAGLEREMSEQIGHQIGKRAGGLYIPTNIGWGQRGMTVGTAAQGGYLKGTEHMGSEFFEALQARLPLTRYGAQVMSGLTSDVTIPGLGSGVGVGFVAEGGNTSSQTPATKQVSLAPKTMGAYVDVSRKLIVQSDPSVERVLRNDVVRRMANKLYEVALEGGGSNEPSGIIANADTNIVAIGTNGGALTYQNVVDLIKEVDLDNALDGSLAMFTTPGVLAKMRTTPKQASGVEGNFILDPNGTTCGYKVESTTLMPSDLTKGTGSSLNALLFGDFSQLILGMFGGLDVIVDTSTGSISGSTRFVFLQDVDVGVRHGKAFSVVKDIDLTA